MAHDRKQLRWYGSLPEMVIYHGKQVHDLTVDGRFDEVIDALRIQLSQGHEPVVIRNHDDTSDQIGFVVDMEVLTLAEAKERGIRKQTSERMLYLGARPASQGSLDKTELGSVDILPNIKDESGYTHRFYLNELSILPDPHIRKQQTPSSELSMKFSAFAAPTFGDTMPDPTDTAKTGADTEAMKDAQIASLTEELATANARIAELEGAELQAEADVEAAKLGMDKEMTVKLAALYVRDKDAFTLSAAGITAAKAAAPAPAPAPAADPTQETALTLSADGTRQAGRGVKEEDLEQDMNALAGKAYKLQAAKEAEGETMTFAAAMTIVTHEAAKA